MSIHSHYIEALVLTLESSRQTTLLSHASRNAAYLLSREEEKLRRQREVLRRVAPGFEPSGGTLVPTPVHRKTPASGSTGLSMSSGTLDPPSGGRDAMDDLVDQLAAMDSAKEGNQIMSNPSRTNQNNST